jgi:hypothetical protein
VWNSVLKEFLLYSEHHFVHTTPQDIRDSDGNIEQVCLYKIAPITCLQGLSSEKCNLVLRIQSQVLVYEYAASFVWNFGQQW